MVAVSAAGDAVLDGLADAIGMMSHGDLDEDAVLVGYFRSIDAMSRANLIEWNEWVELRDLYWQMQYQPEPALIEPRVAA
jgi:hypothetical protein